MLYFYSIVYHSWFLSLTLHHEKENSGIMGNKLSGGIECKGAVQYRQRQRIPLQSQESGGEVSVSCKQSGRFRHCKSTTTGNTLGG